MKTEKIVSIVLTPSKRIQSGIVSDFFSEALYSWMTLKSYSDCLCWDVELDSKVITKPFRFRFANCNSEGHMYMDLRVVGLSILRYAGESIKYYKKNIHLIMDALIKRLEEEKIVEGAKYEYYVEQFGEGGKGLMVELWIVGDKDDKEEEETEASQDGPEVAGDSPTAEV